MELSPVNCNHCGASLQVPPNARFVTCRYCSTQLEIERTESTITTEVLDRIDTRTASMAEDLQALRRESEIERLDREWAQTQASLMIRDQHGNTSRPSAAGGIAGAFIMGAVGILWMIGSLIFIGLASHSTSTFSTPPGFPASALPASFMPVTSVGPPAIIKLIFPLFGIGFVIGAIVLGIKSTTNAGRLEEAERRYQSRRRQLLEQQSASC